MTEIDQNSIIFYFDKISKRCKVSKEYRVSVSQAQYCTLAYLCHRGWARLPPSCPSYSPLIWSLELGTAASTSEHMPALLDRPHTQYPSPSARVEDRLFSFVFRLLLTLSQIYSSRLQARVPHLVPCGQQTTGPREIPALSQAPPFLCLVREHREDLSRGANKI